MEEATNPEVNSVPRTLRPLGVHRVHTRPDEWVDDAGAAVIDPAVLDRVRRLAIPPAWTDVWATLDASASVQATGVDRRGRTQYRYAPEAIALATDRKFDQMLDFAAALPALRKNVIDDLARGHHDVRAPRTVTAAVVRLLDRGLLRVGNERYARDNHTYGLTTLRRNQVAVHGPTINFDFVGKEHVTHRVAVNDRAAARVVSALLATEGDDESPLFSSSGEHPAHLVTSAAVNAYLHSHTGRASDGQGVPNLGCNCCGGSGARRSRVFERQPSPAEGTLGHRSRGRITRRHRCGHPLVVHPPGLARRWAVTRRRLRSCRRGHSLADTIGNGALFGSGDPSSRSL